ncbi:MAG: response regulator [Pseudomonadota bacterium]
MSGRSRVRLSHALPVAALLLVAAYLLSTGLYGWYTDRAALLARVQAEGLTLAQTLARTAERRLQDHPDEVKAEIGLASADLRVRQLALVSPAGVVEAAHRIAWEGRRAVDVVEGFDDNQFQAVALGYLPFVAPQDGGRRVRILVPYLQRVDEPVLRNLRRGAVWMELDLSQELDRLLRATLVGLLTGAVLGLSAMGLLAWLLRRYVALPLARLRDASVAFMEGRAVPPLPEQGPEEIGTLVRTFNAMVDRLQVAQQRLRDSEAHFRTLAEAGRIFVWRSDADGALTYVNDVWCRFSGRPRSALLGHGWRLDMHPQDRASFADAFDAARARGGHLAAELRLRDASGQWHWLLMEGNPLRRDDGGVAGYVGHAMDITDLKTAQEALQQLNDELEQRVQARTQELQQANEQLRAQELLLRDATARAEAASRAKSDFLANVSHEIRTPMNAIIGLAHLLARSPLDDKQRDYLDKLQQSAQHLLGLINDILDLSKIESGKLELEQTEFALDQLIESFAALIADKAQAKGLELIVDVAPDVPPRLIGDPLRLGQILINYGNNAVKFTEHGEVRLRVRVERRDGDDVWLRLQVEDTGIGLTPAQQAQLFQSFQQADTSITRRYGGTGLGLAIVKRLAQLMDGSVGVRSEAGKGSTFWAVVHVRVGAATPVAPPPLEVRGRRVLVVDDNPTAREVLCDQLRALGFVAAAAAGGAEALRAAQDAAARQQPFDVVLLDWQMPGLDGFETGARLRALQLQPPPRLLLITAFGREEVFARVESEGFDGVLFKPVSPSMLLDHLMQALGARAASAGAPAPAPTTGVAPPPGLVGRRVLLVEDNAINRDVARELLQEAGLLVEEAENGLQALQRVRERPAYDVILMDMQMPLMDGLEATRRIRALPGWGTVPIVAMTANVLAEDRQRCLEAGMNDFLPKPIDPPRLWATLQRWMPAADAAPAAPTADGASAAQPVAAPTSAPALAVPAVDGLDSADGLRRAAGRVALYRSLLQRFVAEQAQATATIAALWAAGQRDAAIRAAHRLKGVSATLGAHRLAQHAAELQQALQAALQQDPPPPTLADMPAWAATDAALQALVQGLRRALELGESSPAQAGTRTAGGSADMAEFARLLALGDAAALAWADAHEDALRTLTGPAYPALRAALTVFDFEAALSTLRATGQVAREPQEDAP